MSFDHDRYNQFVATSPQGTLFCTTWWLDTVAPGSYQILTVEKDTKIQAAWPLVSKSAKLSGPIITMAPLTPWLGVLYEPMPAAKLTSQLSTQKELATELIQRLPRFGRLHVNFHRNFEYWLPFYWQDFQQTTRYTYIFENLSDLEAIWAGLRENIRREIRKARREGIIVESSDDLEGFWRIHTMTFTRQNLTPPYPFELVQRLDQVCRERNTRRIFVGRDQAGEIHAVAYIVWDHQSAYYLMGGGDPDKRSSGVTSLVMWEAIKFAATVANSFDFEGSMLEPVERFFRAFGARPCPYFQISKINSPMYQTYRFGRTLLKRKN